MDEMDKKPETQPQVAPEETAQMPNTAASDQTANTGAYPPPSPAQPQTSTPVENAAAVPDAQPAPPAPGTQPAQPVPPASPAQPVPPAAPAGSYVAPTPSPTPALVLGILAIVFCWIPIVGIILGIIAIVQAGKYFKAGGTEGSAKGGKICGIIGIVLSGIMIIVNCITMFIGLSVLDSLDNYDTSGRNIVVETQSSASADIDAEDQEIFDAVDPYLDQLKNKDPQMVSTIANLMESSFDEIMHDYDIDITLQGCGVDPTELADAMLDDFDYTPDYALNSGDEAEADYDVMVKSAADILTNFYDELVKVITETSEGSLTDQEAYSKIGTALMNAVHNTEADESYFDVDVNHVDGKWQIDLDSWQDELVYFFSLY